MATFTIDSENNIAAHAAVPANLDNLRAFAAEKELAKLAAEWPGSRLGRSIEQLRRRRAVTELKAVKKFTNRKALVARIWAAVQLPVPGRCGTRARRGADEGGGERSSPTKTAGARPCAKRRDGAEQEEGGGDRD